MAQQADPDCAMCLWGEAWVLGPHINFIMEEDAGRRAVAALERARQLAPQAGELRAALIAALSQRYAADPKADRKPLDQAFADAMRQVQARWPADPEVAMLTADALMNLCPWDYWEDAGRKPKGATAETLALLEGVLGARPSPITANPLHPGAIHLYIHTVEASDHPERAAPHAARLAALMPSRRACRAHAGAYLVPARAVARQPRRQPPRRRGGRGADRPRRGERAAMPKAISRTTSTSSWCRR